MRRTASALAVAALAVGLTGCELRSDPAPDSVGKAARAAAAADAAAPKVRQVDPVVGAPEIVVFAPLDPEFELTGPTTDLPAGPVNIDFSTEGNHNFALAGPGLPEPLLWGSAGGQVVSHIKYAVALLPGTYVYWCSVPGHRNAGMEGKLTVA